MYIACKKLIECVVMEQNYWLSVYIPLTSFWTYDLPLVILLYLSAYILEHLHCFQFFPWGNRYQEACSLPCAA